ncbi:hypothetical protein M1523_04605 [Patescibacteria group bacterium]|nr:hypothetical protein [Patescibacteria group bacterium]
MGKTKKITKLPWQHHWRRAGGLATGSLLALLLLLNLVSSQQISPLYFSLADGSHGAAINYLRRISRLDIFPDQLKQYAASYGNNLEQQIFAEKYQREAMINKLEQDIKKNPKAKDVLYRLCQLYQAKGDEKRAQSYRQMAQAIDPAVP